MSPISPETRRRGPDSSSERLVARTLGGAVWSYLTTAIRIPLTLLVLAILSRLLTPEDFGLFGIAWILLDLGRRLAQISIGHAIVQQHELTGRQINAGFVLSTAIGFVVAAMLWLLAPAVGRMFDEPATPQLVQALSAVFVIGGVGVVSEHLLRRDLRFRDLAAPDLLSYALGNGITACGLAAWGVGVWALVWGELVRTSIRTAAVIVYAPPRPRLHVKPRAAADLMFRGAGFSIIQMSDFIAKAGGYFAVGRWLGVASLGYYTRADRLASLLVEYVGGNLFEVAFPAMARRQQRVNRLHAVYRSSVEALSLVMLPASMLMLVTAPEIVFVLLGGQWDAAVPAFRILSLTIPFRLCGVLDVAVVRAMGGVYSESWRQATHAALVVLGVWIGSRRGLSGVAIGIVGAQIVAYLLMAQAALTQLGVRWGDLLRRHLPALWVGSWAVLAVGATAGGLRALAASAAVVLAGEILVWVLAVVAAVRLAPSATRPECIPWALARLPFDVFGTPGRYMRNGLEWLTASHGWRRPS